jgi:redox-sensitive bicupin YhaK (pirin superfamily)
MKKLSFIQRNNERHWVGDGFPVRSIFSYSDRAADFSPFLLLDYAGPAEFPPTTERRGVGEHPHRGFETVTIVYSGELEHRDSSGGGGVIGPGDVQWMTAGSGIVHQEFHGPKFARSGGPFEVVQLWVNLAAKDKKAPPAYQNLTDASIPQIDLPDGAGRVRVIAGEYAGRKGPARTFSPMNVWDVRVKAGHRAEFKVPPGHTTAFLVLRGRVKLPESEVIGEAEIAVLERTGGSFAFEASADATVLVLSGEPIDEPVVGYGPFVMNSEAEIRQAIADFNNGKMGRIAAQA